MGALPLSLVEERAGRGRPIDGLDLAIPDGDSLDEDPTELLASSRCGERFGLQLGTADQLFFDQLEATWMTDHHPLDQARANPIENLRLVFNDVVIKSIVGRMDDNEDIFKKILDEPAFQTAVMDRYLRRVFDRARTGQPESP